MEQTCPIQKLVNVKYTTNQCANACHVCTTYYMVDLDLSEWLAVVRLLFGGREAFDPYL